MRASPDGRAHRDLDARLQSRRAEIETAIQDRVKAISDPAPAADSTYAEGLREAVAAAVDFALAAVERAEPRTLPVPLALLAQARLAARSGIGLDTVLRRYLAGHALLTDFLIEEATWGGVEDAELKSLLRNQSSLLDRLLTAVSEEYSREAHGGPATAEKHRVECVRGLLSGESLDTTGLAYDFDGHHVGLLAGGSRAAEALADLLAGIDCRQLVVQSDERTAWAWLGARQGLSVAGVEAHLSSASPPQLALALGEPAAGLGGWRLTHRQAAAALPVALRGARRVARYGEVALLAAALESDLLATSLRRLYLDPLEGSRDGGAASRKALSTYFAAERNVSSTAAKLGLSRRTVANRLRAIEERLGRPLGECAADLEVALGLEALGDSRI